MLMAIWGTANGVAQGNYLAVVQDFCSTDQLVILLSIELVFEGIGAIIAALLCGKPLCVFA